MPSSEQTASSTTRVPIPSFNHTSSSAATTTSSSATRPPVPSFDQIVTSEPTLSPKKKKQRKEKYLASIFSDDINEHFKFVNANPKQFNSSSDEKSQPDDDEKTVEHGTPLAGNEENEENVARRDPYANDHDSGNSMDESTLNYSEDNNDKKSTDNSLDDDRKPAAK